MYFSTTAEARKKATYNGDLDAQFADEAKDGGGKFGRMMNTYGPTFLWTYLSVYALTLGGLYVGVESGMLDPVTLLGYINGSNDEVGSTAEALAELMKQYTLTEPFVDTVQEKPHLANLAIAWITTKFTEPIRLGTSAAVVPVVARHFGVVPNAGSSDGEKGEEGREESVTEESTDQAASSKENLSEKAGAKLGEKKL
ncbi:Protein of unknown function (DUF1279) [Seminavis robusta]|uniref:DUF1279 domain-containing protein n=1 Tax=Seminavis robusta TaxID=568900 RepID=A0A9N8EHJ6_9STRA|nr:Protein of unknown function (DUF1279) [Seminavis robusta]|eukprot:Sro1200_g251880.1 Protein of unknown function (DUF1279) (198) ;mRNA; r:18958-19551